MSSDAPSLEQPTDGGQGNQLRFVLDVILRHWMLMAVFTVASTILVGTIGTLMRVGIWRYEATADLVIKQSPWDRPVMRGLSSNVFGPTTPKALKEQADLAALAVDVTRMMVEEDVQNGGPLANLTSAEEYQKKALEIGSMIRLDDLNEVGILRLRVGSLDKALAMRIAELAARVLVERSQRHQEKEQDDAYELVVEQLNDLREQLDEAERSQWSFREEIGFKTHDQVWETMDQSDTTLTTSRKRRKEIAAQLIEIQSALKKNSEDLPSSLGSVSENTVVRLMIDLEGLLGEKVELLVEWLPGSPGLADIEDEILAKQQAVQLAIGELDEGSGGASGLWTQRQSLYRKKVDLELEATSTDTRIASLESELGLMVTNLPELADQSFKYEQLSHQTEQIRRQFDLMLAKEFQIKAARERGMATLERRDDVVSSSAFEGTSSPIWASFMLGAFIGFVVGFAFAMLVELMDTSIRSIEDVNKYVNLEVLGMIPLMKFGRPRGRKRHRGAYITTTDETQADACIVTQHDPKSPVSEAYRSLRTNFQFATLRKQPKTVMITSAVPGEGKTTTAVNFAVTMADRGMRVLIVDTDLRRPNVHRVLRLDRGPGLADVLRERMKIENVIRDTRIENLWSISSGRVPPNPSELIGSERMKKLMEELSAQFDLVICDAPSILVVTDPVLLATQIDTVVMVISVNNARRETIQRAKALVETANPSIAGVVLNGLEATRRHYYYYYYYYDELTAPSRRRWYQNI